MDIKTFLCPFCMKEVQEETCPYCGNPVSYTGDPAHLQVGYILSGMHSYILGAALGQGGFGITYIALDMKARQRVAVKEYFPTYCAARNDNFTVDAYPGQEEIYTRGRSRFLNEARMLKNLSDLSSVVNVLDFFEANNTAYLVMEYLEGCSLKDHIKQTGKLETQPFLKQLRPLMADMEKMHQRGVVHRDIAPDNIIMLPDGRLKLIDFGAARFYVGDKSMTVVVKKGFAPVEQYIRKGTSACTDVYALAATIYYCITGIVPPDSAERQYGEVRLGSPNALGAKLTPSQEAALEKALVIQSKDRTQTVAELMVALKPESEPEKTEQNVPDRAAAPRRRTWLIPACATVLLLLGGGRLLMLKNRPEAPVQTQTEQIAVPETIFPEATVPETQPALSPEAMQYNEAVDFFNNKKYGKAAIAFAKLGGYRDAEQLSRQIWDAIAPRSTIAVGKAYTAAVKEDGSVLVCGDSAPSVKSWSDIIAVTDASETLIGLKADGTVVCANSGKSWKLQGVGWTDIVSVTGDCHFAFGLRRDGTVVADRICDHVVQEESVYLEKIASFRDVVKIDALTRDESFKNFPLLYVQTADGTETLDFTPCENQSAVDADLNLIGLTLLKADGTVSLQPNNLKSSADQKKAEAMTQDMGSWSDVIAIAGRHSKQVLALKADGTVAATGNNSTEQCEVGHWKNVVAVDTGYNHSVGLQSDGTLVTCGGTMYRARKTTDWRGIKLPADKDALLTAIAPVQITEPD